ncbi:MAG: UDP-N-acetylmuramate dehydrogenase [Spirochaetes bacterium]|nr:UDP-N-acetylmuramate dehydrogenase [Spirochaetota bacterium]
MAFLDRVRSSLPRSLSVKISPPNPLSKRTTLRCGGHAPLLELESPEEAGQALEALRAHQIPFYILGRGSNLIVADGELDLLFLTVRNQGAPRVDPEGRVVFSADQALPGALAWCHANGWLGLEWAAGIPGTMGGAVRMNAGTRGGEIKDNRPIARVLSAGEDRWKAGAELGLAYRHSALSAGDLVWECALALKKAEGGAVEEARREVASYLKKRNDTQPLDQPSFGSTFANPSGDSAGRLIEAAGLKGRTRGGAMVSPKHANFVVNTGSATARDVVDLIREVREAVERAHGIVLRTEVCFAGFQKDPLA